MKLNNMIKINLISFLYAFLGMLIFEVVNRNDFLISSNKSMYVLGIILIIIYTITSLKIFKGRLWPVTFVLLLYIFYFFINLFLSSLLLPPWPEEDLGVGLIAVIIHSINYICLIIGSVISIILSSINKDKKL